MKKATISYTKNKLSALLDLVKAGETILITDRGRPVARLEPAEGTGPEYEEARLQRLVRKGIVTPAKRPVSKHFFDLPIPKPSGKGDILKALLDERAEGR